MLRVAVIGAGHWGPNLVSNFHANLRSRVAWVIDRDPDRLRQVGRRHPDIQLGRDPAAAFSDPEVDAVVVATPTSTHYEIASNALTAGKHVFVEKPITHSLETAEQLARQSEQVGRLLMVGHVFVYNPAAQRVKQYLSEEDLGRIYYVSMVRTNLGPIRVDVNAAWDLAAHDIALASYWLDAQPVSVTALGGSWLNPGIEDAVFATLRYPDEVLVHLHASWLNPRKSRDITVVGEKRMLTFDDMSLGEPLKVYDKGVDAQRSPAEYVDSFASFRMSVRDGDVRIPRVSSGEPLRLECEHFLDCIANGQVPLTGAREGVAVVRALEAIGHSMRDRGREQAVTP